MHVLDDIAELQEMKQQWSRYIVRQIADQSKRATKLFRQFAEIEFQCVRLVNHQLAVRLHAFAEQGNDIAIQFDGMQCASAFQYRQGQCAKARTDLDQSIACRGIDDIDDTLDDAIVMQEMLSESFLGLVAVHDVASISAMRNAAARLLVLALLVPASSYAVP